MARKTRLEHPEWWTKDIRDFMTGDRKSSVIDFYMEPRVRYDIQRRYQRYVEKLVFSELMSKIEKGTWREIV